MSLLCSHLRVLPTELLLALRCSAHQFHPAPASYNASDSHSTSSGPKYAVHARQLPRPSKRKLEKSDRMYGYAFRDEGNNLSMLMTKLDRSSARGAVIECLNVCERIRSVLSSRPEGERAPSLEVYKLLLRALAKQGLYASACRVIVDLEAVGLSADLDCFNSLLQVRFDVSITSSHTKVRGGTGLRHLERTTCLYFVRNESVRCPTERFILRTPHHVLHQLIQPRARLLPPRRSERCTHQAVPRVARSRHPLRCQSSNQAA